jgi:enoyl-CoA hydratase/carnithine racemase
MLALAQDLRIAEASARLGLPEITLGFTPSYGIARLLDVLGGAHARDLLLTGRALDAAEALRVGLVTRLVPDGALEEAATALAAGIAEHPRAGLAATKAVIAETRAGRPGGEARAYAAALRDDPEARARIAAFLARKGRRR